MSAEFIIAILDFLNKNSGAFSVVFTAFVAIATIVYAILTWKLVSETKKMREAQTEPKVSAIVQANEKAIQLIDLIIQNIGLGPAYDIEFKLDPDFVDKDGKLSDVGIMKYGLKYLAPNQKIQIGLTTIIGDYAEKIKVKFKIIILYKNSLSKSYTDEYLIDFSQFIGMSRLETNEDKIVEKVDNIASNIGSIGRDINSISSSIKKISEQAKPPLERTMPRDNLKSPK